MIKNFSYRRRILGRVVGEEQVGGPSKQTDSATVAQGSHPLPGIAAVQEYPTGPPPSSQLCELLWHTLFNLGLTLRSTKAIQRRMVHALYNNCGGPQKGVHKP